MRDNECGPAAMSELDEPLSDLLAQVKKEPISTELQELAARLDAALLTARVTRSAAENEPQRDIS
ncbi:hypothetical protein H4P12_12550 [Paracoccus sp. 11-3]|uniref:Uncharacterized protein n=1 Tax=Paracoccus amoyensis TaxID=2760093 RepID=A0A926GAM3_9RHOB|nr:hypothetical protein [Paracoccus amoyensis]MBC9247518.1 hypothetical protein [Paracoccus amoyensis]